MTPRRSGGGFAAIRYALKKAREAGGLVKMFRALRTRNTCKTCALGMGGQRGGMVNEKGKFPEVCKKSVQAMAADMQAQVPPNFLKDQDLKLLSPRELEAAGRLTVPLYAGPDDDRYRTIAWDDALDRITAKLNDTDPKEAFFYLSGRSSNEAGFLLQLFARMYGTNNISNCSYYCHQASGVALASVTGSGTATIDLDDLSGCDLVFLIGANPASNHPRLMRTLVDIRRRGGKVIVVNPLREAGLESFKVPSDLRSMLFGSKTSDLYVQPHAGGDIAFLSGVAKATIESGDTDEQFVQSFTEGWNAFRNHVAALTWDEIVEKGGVDRQTIQGAADLYAKSKNAVFCWAMGVTHHAHGVGNVQMIADLAMVRGMLGKPNCGLLPLRGHSNVQGIGSMGVVPNLKEKVFERLQSCFGIQLPQWKGLDTLGCIEAAADGRMRTAFCLGGNLFGANPDADFAHRALGTIDQVVYLSTTLNSGHAWGRGKETIVLPVLARDEEPQPTTQESMFSYVRLSDGGPRRLQGPRSEVQIIADLAAKLLGDGSPIDWKGLRHHGRIREAIAKVIPGYEMIADIEKSKQEFQIKGRTFHEPRFPTQSGKAKFHVVELPRVEGGLRLITVRSEGQFNTVVYEEEDTYRGQDRRDVVMLHPDDIDRLGLSIDQNVTVASQTGELANMRVRAFDVRPGNAVMYYPEANMIVPRRADPASRTPAFKNTQVTIRPTPPEQIVEPKRPTASARRGKMNAC